MENSIISTIANLERLENLPIKKYSRNQYVEIASYLNRKDEKIRVVTYNILFNHYDENLEEINRWSHRVARVIAAIEEMQADLIGIQELYLDQFEDIRAAMEKSYIFYSQACSDGELNGIFYRKDRFEVINSNVWHMKNSVDILSYDTLTMLQLKDVKTGKYFAIFNTHLAFSDIDVRDWQSQFVAEHIESYADTWPIILTGDFNTFPHRLDLLEIPFYDGDYIQHNLTKGALQDAKDRAILGHIGPLSTFTNSEKDVLPFKGIGTPGVFLDHIYVSKNIYVLIHATQPGTIHSNFPSDHLPIIVDCFINN